MSEKFVPYEKMSKKAKQLHNRIQRNANGFNTGTRIHKVKTKYDRHAIKAETREIMGGI